jgi:hypothetical protein
MSQCAGVSAHPPSQVRHEPLTPTILAILVAVLMQAWITFGSSFPSCALANAGMAMNKSVALTVENLISLLLMNHG